MRELKTYYYIPNILDNDELDVENAYSFNSERDIMAVNGGYDDFEVSWLVEEMASDYLRNRDGWEVAHSWEGDYRDFVVWDSDKNLIGTYEVLLEYSPSFTAWKKK